MNLKERYKAFFYSDEVASFLLIAFIALYFFFPYKILGLSFTLNTLFMGVTAPIVLMKLKMQQFKLFSKLELITAVSFLVCFLFSAVILHPEHTRPADFVSYGSSFLTFGYVFILSLSLKLRSLFKFFLYFILASAFVILLEVTGGSVFYISNYLDHAALKKVFSRFACGFSTNSIHEGGLLIIAFTFSVFYSFVHEPDYLRRMKNHLFFLLGLVSIYLTMSRAAWGSFILVNVFIAGFFLANRQYKHLKSLLIISAIFIAGLNLLSHVPPSVYSNPGMMKSRITLNFNKPFGKYSVDKKDYDVDVVYNDIDSSFDAGNAKRSDLSGNLRMLSLKLSFKLMQESFFKGIGLNEFPDRFNAEYRQLILDNLDVYDRLFFANTHNTFLEYYVEMGAIVGLPLTAFVLLLLFRLLQLTRRKSEYLPVLAVFLVSICWSQFIDVSRDKILYIILAVCWAFTCRTGGEKNSAENIRPSI